MLSFSAVGTTPLAAETIFQLGPIAISNSMFYGLIGAFFTITILMLAASWSQLYPRSRLAFYVETLIDFIHNIALDSFSDKKKALKHLPLLATLFIFILVSNIAGLLPGVGTITATSGGHEVSLLRAFTTDLNATLAMAVLTIGLVQFYALRELGLRKHIRHYFTLVSANPANPMNIFIGLIELFGELLRIVTLSMRLFGVIYAGEVLISAVGILAGNLSWAASLPTVLLEIFFSIIQAYIFMMLTATYLSIATHKDEEQGTVSEQHTEAIAGAK